MIAPNSSIPGTAQAVSTVELAPSRLAYDEFAFAAADAIDVK